MSNQHVHGPNCSHGHGNQGHSHGHGQQGQMMGGGLGTAPDQLSPQQYFTKLRRNYGERRQFFWHDVLMGVAKDKWYEKQGLSFMRSLSCKMLVMVIGAAEMFLNFDWVPFIIKPFSQGLFFPMLFLMFFNFNITVGIGKENITLRYLIYSTLVAYIFVALRGSGNLNSDSFKNKIAKAYQTRPYLTHPQMSCQSCKIIKVFRSVHCPVCKICVPKHTRHSLVFGICIGASNQLLSMLFFLIFSVTHLLMIYVFLTTTSYSLLTQGLFYFVNGYLCWQSLTEFGVLLFLNLGYGITEQEIQSWPRLQYLVRMPSRQYNNCNNLGFCHNLIESLCGLLGVDGFESKGNRVEDSLAFPDLELNKKYIVNWSKAFFYLVPQMPNHPNRQHIIDIMKTEEPKMIEMFKLKNKFREEVLQELQVSKEQLNEMQIEQKTMMKMQAHMMKNMPQNHMAPSAQQQKVMQLQMLGHMKRQLGSQPEFANQIQLLETKLREGNMSAIEVNMSMRQIQQQLMAKKMQEIIKQRQEQEKPMLNQEDEHEKLKKELPDEDL